MGPINILPYDEEIAARALLDGIKRELRRDIYDLTSTPWTFLTLFSE